MFILWLVLQKLILIKTKMHVVVMTKTMILTVSSECIDIYKTKVRLKYSYYDSARIQTACHMQHVSNPFNFNLCFQSQRIQKQVILSKTKDWILTVLQLDHWIQEWFLYVETFRLFSEMWNHFWVNSVIFVGDEDLDRTSLASYAVSIDHSYYAIDDPTYIWL